MAWRELVACVFLAGCGTASRTGTAQPSSDAGQALVDGGGSSPSVDAASADAASAADAGCACPPASYCSDGACIARVDKWSPGPRMPQPRSNHASGTGPDGRVYVFGGIVPATDNTAVWTLDLEQSSWSSVAPLVTDHETPGGAVGSDGHLYCIGGYLNTRVESYDANANRWSAAPPLPAWRDALGATRTADGRIFAIGGRGDVDGGAAGPVSKVESLDPSAGSWSAHAPMPTARSGVLAVLDRDGNVYAIGGLGMNVASAPLATVEVYDPTTDTWASRTPMPTPRDGAAGALGPDGRIYVIGGGAETTVLDVVEAYDPKTDAWSSVARIPVARSYAGAAVTTDGRIVVSGGITNGPNGTTMDSAPPTDDVEIYTP